jgi:hypothetical protein
MDMIFVPVEAKLYNDIVRLSDGRLNLIELAIDQFHEYFRRTVDDDGHGWFGDRFDEYLQIYHPDLHEARDVQAANSKDQSAQRLQPLVWKNVTLPGGTMVRMQYGNAYHFARVLDGAITDESGSYSPSEWASKVASGTSRNAWRDLWFRLPGSVEWVPARKLRKDPR